MKKRFKKLLVGVLAFVSLSSVVYASDEGYSDFMHAPSFDAFCPAGCKVKVFLTYDDTVPTLDERDKNGISLIPYKLLVSGCEHSNVLLDLESFQMENGQFAYLDIPFGTSLSDAQEMLPYALPKNPMILKNEENKIDAKMFKPKMKVSAFDSLGSQTFEFNYDKLTSIQFAFRNDYTATTLPKEKLSTQLLGAFTDTYGKPTNVSQTPTTGAHSYRWVYSGTPTTSKTALSLTVILNKEHSEQVYISLSDLNLEIQAK